MRDLAAFETALGAGDVVSALVAAPFGYSSSKVAGGFRFTIDPGSRKGTVGEAPTLLEAVRLAYSRRALRGAP